MVIASGGSPLHATRGFALDSLGKAPRPRIGSRSLAHNKPGQKPLNYYTLSMLSAVVVMQLNQLDPRVLLKIMIYVITKAELDYDIMRTILLTGAIGILGCRLPPIASLGL